MLSPPLVMAGVGAGLVEALTTVAVSTAAVGADTAGSGFAPPPRIAKNAMPATARTPPPMTAGFRPLLVGAAGAVGVAPAAGAADSAFSAGAATRVAGTEAALALITIVPISATTVAGIFSTARAMSRPNSGAVWYRSLASRARALSITPCNSADHCTSGFISASFLGWSVSRMIMASCAELLGNGSLPVRQLNATRPSE